jgi:hypothetical protein
MGRSAGAIIGDGALPVAFLSRSEWIRVHGVCGALEEAAHVFKKETKTVRAHFVDG